VRWLWVVALPAEAAPLMALLRHARPASGRTWEGRLGDDDVRLLVCGVGPRAAHRRTRVQLQAAHFDAVLNLGTCGALRDDLSIGQVVAATAVRREEAHLAGLAVLGGHRAVHVATVRRPVWSADARVALAATGADVCEMELAGVWRAVEETSPGLPLMALKVVSDLAGAEADDAVGAKGLWAPVQVARFKLRALRLCNQHLAPAVRAALSAPSKETP
jgi:nucleoside phosphorylase